MSAAGRPRIRWLATAAILAAMLTVTACRPGRRALPADAADGKGRPAQEADWDEVFRPRLLSPLHRRGPYPSDYPDRRSHVPAAWEALPAATVVEKLIHERPGWPVERLANFDRYFPADQIAGVLAQALLEDDGRARGRASSILLYCRHDAELANALGFAMRHGLAVQHHIDLLGRLPRDTVYSLPLLRRLYGTDEPRIAAAAARAALRLGLNDREDVRFFTGDGGRQSEPIRLAVAVVLDRAGRKHATACLLELGESAASPEVRVAAIAALGIGRRPAAVRERLFRWIDAGGQPDEVIAELSKSLLQLTPPDDPRRGIIEARVSAVLLATLSSHLDALIAAQRQIRSQTETEQRREFIELLGLDD